MIPLFHFLIYFVKFLLYNRKYLPLTGRAAELIIYLNSVCRCGRLPEI